MHHGWMVVLFRPRISVQSLIWGRYRSLAWTVQQTSPTRLRQIPARDMWSQTRRTIWKLYRGVRTNGWRGLLARNWLRRSRGMVLSWLDRRAKHFERSHRRCRIGVCRIFGLRWQPFGLLSSARVFFGGWGIYQTQLLLTHPLNCSG